MHAHSSPPLPALPADKAARMAVFRRFLEEECGGIHARAAEALSVDRSLVTRLVNGDRNMTPELAEAIEAASAGRFPKQAMLWPLDFPLPPPREAAR